MAAEIQVERMLPISTVAELLGTGRDYVMNRADAGEFTIVELGDQKPKKRIPESSYLAFIAGRTVGRRA